MSNKLNLIKLKIKNKSLAEESRIIRKEERKLTGSARDNLVEHRKFVVRAHARATHLAIAFLKHRPYRSIEKTCYNTVYRDMFIIPKMKSMVMKYGTMVDKNRSITAWLAAE